MSAICGLRRGKAVWVHSDWREPRPGLSPPTTPHLKPTLSHPRHQQGWGSERPSSLRSGNQGSRDHQVLPATKWESPVPGAV